MLQKFELVDTGQTKGGVGSIRKESKNAQAEISVGNKKYDLTVSLKKTSILLVQSCVKFHLFFYCHSAVVLSLCFSFLKKPLGLLQCIMSFSQVSAGHLTSAPLGRDGTFVPTGYHDAFLSEMLQSHLVKDFCIIGPRVKTFVRWS